MKLLTHNLLTSRSLKNVAVGFPLKIKSRETKVTSVDFNEEFVKRMLPKMDWPALKEAATVLGVELPNEAPELTDTEGLQKVHHALFEVEILEGELICPETGRSFPIKQGIPNMLCNEDEIK